MPLNNTPLNWKNKTEFVPTKPEEKTMSTFDYLNNAETELRNALKSTTDLSQAYQLRRIVDTINTVEEIKNQFKFSVSEDSKIKDGFFHSENFEDMYGGMPFPSASSPDKLILG
ncbi:hypothetical protein EB001_01060 [bacterium]|nr:hypothetical protein [bacterium]